LENRLIIADLTEVYRTTHDLSFISFIHFFQILAPQGDIFWNLIKVTITVYKGSSATTRQKVTSIGHFQSKATKCTLMNDFEHCSSLPDSLVTVIEVLL